MLLTVLIWVYFLATLLGRAAWLPLWRRRALGYRRITATPVTFLRTPPKPVWVRKEVIRLKALMPEAGCRCIPDSFNRRFAAKKRITVGKTFVSEFFRERCYEVESLRRQIKNARPRPGPKNLVWGVDPRGKGRLDGSPRIGLGFLEHEAGRSIERRLGAEIEPP